MLKVTKFDEHTRNYTPFHINVISSKLILMKYSTLAIVTWQEIGAHTMERFQMYTAISDIESVLNSNNNDRWRQINSFVPGEPYLQFY